MAKLSADASILGAKTQVSGRVSGKGSLRVEGQVNGEISVTGPMELMAGALVDGDVSAQSLDIAGTLRGDAKCSGPITVRAGANVKGDLVAASVSVEAGSSVDVQLDTEFTLDFGSAAARR
jgi:cytoskeletal protein CcmA (bactofilin family)